MTLNIIRRLRQVTQAELVKHLHHGVLMVLDRQYPRQAVSHFLEIMAERLSESLQQTGTALCKRDATFELLL